MDNLKEPPHKKVYYIKYIYNNYYDGVKKDTKNINNDVFSFIC
jgi:hypothetical protein